MMTPIAHPIHRLVIPLCLWMSLAWVTSCGRTSTPSVSPGSPQAQEEDDANIPTSPLSVRIYAAANGHLKCPVAEECHASVVMISAVTKKGIERCTGFLIAPDLVMTNDHCVDRSAAIKSYEGKCDGLIYVHFAATADGAPERSISCQSIVSRSHQKGLDSLDYALLQLKETVTDRAPLRLAERGFNDHEPATVLRVQMQEGQGSATLDGSQNKIQCQAAFKTSLYPAINSSNAPLVTERWERSSKGTCFRVRQRWIKWSSGPNPFAHQ